MAEPTQVMEETQVGDTQKELEDLAALKDEKIDTEADAKKEEAAPEVAKADGQPPAEAPADGQPPAEAPADGQPPAEAPAAPELTGGEKSLESAAQNLQRQLAFLEEAEVEADMVKCKRCHMDLDLAEAVIRGPKELWCRECNSLYSMLRRHQTWPPPNFACLSEDAQASFWQKCKKEKEESMKSQFSYARVRDVLINQLVEEQRKERMTEVGGTFLPLSVYAARGYNVDAGFEERNPRRWSPGLNEWVYLLAEVSISEKEIHATVEKQILEAERAIKKRKAPVMTAEQSEVTEKASNVTSSTMVMDLLSEDEDEEGQKEGQTIYHGT